MRGQADTLTPPGILGMDSNPLTFCNISIDRNKEFLNSDFRNLEFLPKSFLDVHSRSSHFRADLFAYRIDLNETTQPFLPEFFLQAYEAIKKKMRLILVFSTRPDAFDTILKCFRSEFTIERAATKENALVMASRKRYDFILIDIELLADTDGTPDYRAAMQLFWGMYRNSEIIVMARKESTREAVKAVRVGASDYITYPVDPDEAKYVVECVDQYITMQSELNYLRDQFWQSDSLEVIQTKSPQMTAVFNKIRSAAPTISTVLLTGETGTGKGLLARLIHRHSNRGDNQFISVHCGAIPDTLLESELFGHEKGSFTGADRRKLGKFEVANGGTIFLDEIGTLTPAAQIKLLQVLQDGTFQRVGGEETLQVDVRVISATNADLRMMTDSGQFRKDLFYRLNVFPIEIPALKERSEDIPHLTDSFVRRLDRVGGKSIKGVDPAVVECFKTYSWPGNIRELENIMERAYILGSGHMLTRECFPDEIVSSESPAAVIPVDASLTLAGVRRKAIEVAEKTYLFELLQQHQGRIQASAGAAGITPRQLNKLMNKYGIRKEQFKSTPAQPKEQEP
jgi:DNA-binding NtrC family response regulator